ncbi:MAG TPA: chloride channel protein [Vicinamibacteria bacterium]|nr:chloride channel protein [Vicinamibacteria bacterium]
MSRITQWTHRVQERIRELMIRNENQVFLVLTLVIGAVVGLVIVSFIAVTDSIEAALYAEGGPRWRLLVTPILATLIVGYLLYRFFPDARGSGVPQTKAALFARQGHISFRTTVGKFVTSAMTLASGIALGREGPSVQIGGGIASVMGRHLGLPQEKLQMLVPVGAAAALAAAFNTPIAAVLFALEEIMGNLHAPILGSVVISAATSWLVLRLFLGDEPLFHVPEYEVVHPSEFIVYAVLGVVGGLVSVAFVKMMLRLRERFLRMPRKTRWIQPAAGGLVVGVLAFSLPGVFRFGYHTVGQALNGQLDWTHMVILMALSLVATAVCYASGNAGGIFGPSLFIGAMVGGTVGSLAHAQFPAHTATPGAYALVGMGTAFAGILRVPMVSVIMIFEITHDYAIIVPLMISNLISFFVSYRLQRQPIYEALALQDGIHLPHSESAKRHLQVRIAMRPPRETFTTDMTIAECIERAGHSSLRAWPVMDRNGVSGVVSLSQLERALDEERADAKVTVLLDGRTFAHLHADHSLDLALERMGATGYDLLPVVSRANIHDLEGVCSLLDVLRAFGVRGQHPGMPPERL